MVGAGRVLLAALLLIVGAQPGLAAPRVELVDRSSLRVCADPASPPLSTRDGKGYENRIAELLGRELGIPVTYVWFPSGIGFYRNTLNLRRCDVVMGTVTGIDIAQTTIPYYRSTYVLVTRSVDNIAATRIDDPSLRNLKIGAQSGSPAADALARGGMLDQLRAYTMTEDGQPDAVVQRMLQDIAAKRIDAAIVWGPIGAYFASVQPGAFKVVPLASGAEPSPFAFEIGMAVRYGEPQWRARLEQFIRANRGPVQEILMASHVPLLPLLPEKAE